MADPADSSVVYAISSNVGNLTGVLVGGYGVYAENILPELLNKLKIHHEKHIYSVSQYTNNQCDV
jgi:hypothetical protein